MRGLRLLVYGNSGDIGTIFSFHIYGEDTPLVLSTDGAVYAANGGAHAGVRGVNFIKQPSLGKSVAMILHGHVRSAFWTGPKR